MSTVNALLQAIQKLPPAGKRELLRRADWRAKLRSHPSNHMYVHELAVDMNTARAAEALAFRGHGPFQRLEDDVDRILLERERNSELRGEYVRKYVYGLLEVCITDFFILDEDGDWCVDPREFDSVPREVKRYIESIEIKVVRGERRYKINIVSKTAAMLLAAKLTGLAEPEKTPRNAPSIPWEKLASDDSCDDHIEAKILSVSETRS